MRKPFRSTIVAVAALLHFMPAGAAEVWDAPAFSTPAAQLLKAANAIKRERATEVVVLLDERSFVLDEQNRITRRSRMIYRVDSPSGVASWAASSVQWQPWHQAKPTIRARVISADGSEREIDQKLLTDAAKRSADQVFDDEHTLEGPLPAVAVGAVIEEEITIRDEKPFFAGGSVFQEFLGRYVPVLHTRVSIDAPQSLPLRHLVQLLPEARVQQSRESGRVRWSLEQGTLDEITEVDSNLPPDEPSWPSVQFSSAESWEAVVAGYREMTEPRIRSEDAKPLLAGLPTPLANSPTREYVTRLVERLHREVRYTGIEFGDARLIPEYPAETLRRKFGDCKDKSTLLVAALRASGIEAYLALLSSDGGQDVSPELPGLGMFDHAIVYIPGTPELWIDATAEYTRVGTLPAADTNRLALIVRAGEKTLTRTPAMRSADNRQVETREFALEEYGPASAIETTETFGTVEDEYRAWYAGTDTKARLDNLKKYAHDAYRAKSVTNFVHTASTDFTKPYSMRLEMKDASVGFTDLSAAAVHVRVSNLTSRLPDYFDERPEKDPDEPEPKKRKADVVFEPFVLEWRYRIQPPPGFQARKLPDNEVLPMGPARLVSEYALNADGAVQATWRFDTIKDRYTPVEAEALSKALRELESKESRAITFDQIGVALRAEGDFKGALKANDALIAKYPRKAVHRLRSAMALLDAGLGTHAQRDALAATKLEPKSALAWKTLGWTLQRDAVGRRFGEGYDRAGAIAAYRKARALAPKDTDIAADFAVLLEYDAFGGRYSSKPDVDEAIKIYQERRALLDEEATKDDDFVWNLYFAMLYAHHYPELRELLRAEPPNVTQRALMIAAMGAEQGSAPALELARTLVSVEKDRLAALSSASNMLFRLREYPSAADLLEAGSRGEATTAATTQRIAMLRKTRRDDGKSNVLTEPRGVALRWFAELLSVQQAKDPDSMRKLLVPGADALLDGMDSSRAQRVMVAALAKQDIPFAVAGDLMFSNVRPVVEGDDARGYRVQLRSPSDTQTFYVISLDGAYRILTAKPNLGPLAAKALERIDSNDLAGARQWLDWARLDIKPTNTDDPLAGPAFARAWTVGAESTLPGARLASALLLADNGKSERAVPLLLAEQATAGAADKLSLDIALATGYLDLQRWPELREVATRLVAAAPSSAFAFRMQQTAYIQLLQWDVAEAAARARLARLPEDSLAREMQVFAAEERGAFDEIRGIMQPLLDSGRATASDYNQYAWAALLRQPIDEKAVEAARMAYDESQGRSYAIGHTLACVYAAAGKPREARDLLLKAMEMVAMTTPDDAIWYGFGLVAEAYGDTESARDYYTKVQKPKKGPVSAGGVYKMSQARLGALSTGKP
jgi:tetratricopeptide (TPR) repeat protein/transglutaminase-like putative cysteine protease